MDGYNTKVCQYCRARKEGVSIRLGADRGMMKCSAAAGMELQEF